MNASAFLPVSRVTRRGVFAGLAVVLAVGLAAALWQHRELVRAEWTLKSRRTELAHLRAVRPALDATAAERTAADLAAARMELVHRMARLAAPPAESGDDLLVALAEATARWRTLAAAADVKLAPTERFGFAEFAHEAPAETQRPQLMRDLAVVDDLVARLVAAGARELAGIERPPTAEGSAATAASASPPNSAGSSATAADPLGEPARSVVRVSFTGGAETLRVALNGFAAAVPGTRVVSVVVAPTAAPAGDAANQTRRCTVTVERRFAPGGVALALDDSAAPETVSTADAWPSSPGADALFGGANGDRANSASSRPVAGASAEPACSLRLVRVEPRPARVELLGWSELRGEPCALLRDRVSGEVVTLRAGERSAALAVELTAFSAPSWGEAPRVRARDLRSETELTLGAWPVEPTGERQVVLRPAKPARARGEVVATLGEHVRDGAAEYRVVAIHAAPPAVELRAVASDGNSPPAIIRLELTP